MGDIRCGRVIMRPRHYDSLAGYEQIPAWSQGKEPYKQLSPMLLGPLTVTEPIINGVIRPGFYMYPNNPTLSYANVQKFENYWQGSKIYAVDLINPNLPITIENLKPTFWLRRAEMFANPEGKRRALPKAKFGVPISSFYGGVIMDYITSRKYIYSPCYTQLVINHPTFLMLKELHKTRHLLIIGPDGYKPEVPLTHDTLISLINNPSIIWGHELVLCALLLNDIVW